MFDLLYIYYFYYHSSRLCDAKRSVLQQQDVSNPSISAIQKAITTDELSKHCRRRTRGAVETTKAIEDLLLHLTPATDLLGVPIIIQVIIHFLTLH